MSEHTVTVDHYQSGNERHARFHCSCGFSIETVDLRKEPRRVALARFRKEHDAQAAPKPKKSKKQKPVVEEAIETDEWVQPDYDEDGDTEK